MIWDNFVEAYCELYGLDLNPELNGERLVGERLIEMKILAYIIRMYYNPPYSEISEKLGIHKASAFKFYSDVLTTQFYRREAQKRYRECLEHLKEQTKQSA